MKMFKKNSGVLIDLTSLLDVVFIVLLVVICKLYTDKADMAAQQEDIADRQVQLEAQQQLYEDQIDSLGKTGKYITFLSVNAHFDEDLITRHIEVLCSDKDYETPEIPVLSGMNVSDAYEGLEGYLESYVTDHADRIIVVSLNENDDEILYRDEKAIKNILTDLRTAHENVRLKDEEDL